MLHADLLLGVQRDRAKLALLGDRHVRVGHAPVVRARRGEHEPLDTGLTGVGDERLRRLDVDLVGDRWVERARRVADDRGEVDDGVGAAQRALACVGVTDVTANDLDAGLLLLGGDLLLAV